MKKFLFGLAVVLISAALSTVCMLVINDRLMSKQTTETHMWEIAETACSEFQNPKFLTADDAVAYYEYLVDSKITDSLIVSIPREEFNQIATVVIGKNGQCDKKDILMEYLTHHQLIYKYLQPQDSSGDEITTIDGSKAVEVKSDTTNSNGDTVINGKVYKILRE